MTQIRNKLNSKSKNQDNSSSNFGNNNYRNGQELKRVLTYFLDIINFFLDRVRYFE
jgi:hypothetical protein